MASALPKFSPIKDIAPAADFRIIGQKVPRQPHRYSGRTAMLANVSLHEPKPPDDPDTPLSFSMEGSEGQPPAPLIPRYWSPGWNSVQALNKFQQEVGGPLSGGDAGVLLINPPQSPFSKGGDKDDQTVPPLTKGGKREFFFADVPEAFKPKNGEQLIMPLYQSFGAEELSGYSPSIVERTRLINAAKPDTP
jgi:NADH-quinone oxidoreductase subunit G